MRHCEFHLDAMPRMPGELDPPRVATRTQHRRASSAAAPSRGRLRRTQTNHSGPHYVLAHMPSPSTQPAVTARLILSWRARRIPFQIWSAAIPDPTARPTHCGHMPLHHSDLPAGGMLSGKHPSIEVRSGDARTAAARTPRGAFGSANAAPSREPAQRRSPGIARVGAIASAKAIAELRRCNHCHDMMSSFHRRGVCVS
jgi:hypothetical protein